MKQALLALSVGLCLTAVEWSQQSDDKNLEKSVMLKAVVHVNFGEAARQEAGLNNIDNILKEADDTQIEVVCHGEGISLLTKKNSKHADMVEKLIERDVRFVACENTMKKKSLEKSDLIEGAVTVPSGAFEVLRKQQAGYGYFRP